MDTRYIRHARHRARGAVQPVIIAVLVVVALLAVGAWFLIIKPHQDLMRADQGDHPSTPVTAGRAAAAPPVNVEAMSLNQLLAEARRAMNEQRLLAPAGNNAFEFYLKVLQKQPGNQVAIDALRETFPFAATGAEASINQRDFADAQRQIDLLAKADPSNYTLNILRSKLDAQRKTLDREQQQAADREKQQQLAAQKAAADKAEADRVAAEQAKSQQANEQRSSQNRLAQQQAAAEAAARQLQANAAATSNPSTAAAADVGGSHAAVLIRNQAPRYPTAAMRANQEGWVELAFTITASGDVSDVKVVDAQPRHVFDRAAMDAVTRWKYQPATQDGNPIATNKRQRIEFKL